MIGITPAEWAERKRQQQQAKAKPKRPAKPKTSRFVGVHFDKADRWKPWKAQIKINGKKICLGRFADEVEAARAYQQRKAEAIRENSSL